LAYIISGVWQIEEAGLGVKKLTLTPTLSPQVRGCSFKRSPAVKPLKALLTPKSPG